jgi:hypothetical protein
MMTVYLYRSVISSVVVGTPKESSVLKEEVIGSY